MTKEKLKQEAEEKFKEWKSEQYKDQSDEERFEFVEHLHTFPKYFENTFNGGYIASAEPREKQIAQLNLIILGNQEEIAELEKKNKLLLASSEGATMIYNDLMKAREIIKKLLYEFRYLRLIKSETKAEAEKFLEVKHD